MATHTFAFARNLERTHWTTALSAALVAGVTFLILQALIAALIQGYSAMLPLRMIAAIALGTDVLRDGTAYFSVITVAFLIHFGLSIITAWIVAPIIQGMDVAKAMLVGAAAGLVIYLVNFYVMTGIFTWFAAIRGWATLANHLIFGAVLAWTYLHRRRKLD